jgi:pimeloyl-ACP methyl ester carboxylesterase
VALPDLQTIDLDGPVAYREWEGPPDATFLLIHGLGASHLSWIQVAPSLSRLGHTIAVDLPGFGGTPLAARTAGLMDQRRIVSRLLEKLGSGQIVLVGNSMGGAISLLQAAVEPASVSGIVLTGSAFPWRPPTLPNPLILLSLGIYWTPRVGERFVSWRLRDLDPDAIVHLSLRVLAADPRSIPGDVVRELVDLTRRRKDDRDVATAFLQGARSMLRLGARPSIARRALDNVRCPVLVMHGERDRVVPAAYARAELASHPSWRGRFFADLGHIPQMEAPDRWLAEVEAWTADVLAERPSR